MEESRKYFCCPECGARYKVILDGKRYICKKCGVSFQVTKETELVRPISKYKPESRASKKEKILPIAILFIIPLVYFLVRAIENAIKERDRSGGYKYGWIKSDSDVREGRGKDFKIVAKLHKSDFVKIDSVDNGWAVVYYDGNRLGFISKKYISEHSLNTSVNQANYYQPEYIKSVVAYKEGADGLMIYFSLADASGAIIPSDGKVTLSISESSAEEGKVELYSTSFSLKKEDFQKAKVGMGAFEHEIILYSFRRITYSSFIKKSSEMTGKVELEFQRPDGQILKGEETIFF